MIKLIIISITSLFTLSALAELNCSNSSFNYNPNVKQQCEQVNKISADAKQKFKDSFSQSLVKNQNALTLTVPSTGSTTSTTSSTTKSASPSTNATATTTTNTTTQQGSSGTTTTPATSSPNTGSPTKYY